jgi:hypothetical protein
MAKNPYTLDQFNQFKEQVLGRQIARKKISLSEIQIISDSVAKYAGLTFKLDDAAFRSLLRVLGISKGLRAKLIHDFGANFVEKLIEIMSAKTGGNKSEVIMLVDIREKKILNFLYSEVGMISNQSYFSEIEHVIDQYGLNVTGLHNYGNGGFSVSVIAPNSDWGLKGLSDEVFKFGLNFENDPIKGTNLATFNQRLVCTNGMVTQNMLGSTHLINTRDSWENFFHTINTMNKSGFRPQEFSHIVKDAMGVQASIAEIEHVRNVVKSNSLLTDDTLELYLPYRETQNAYAKANMDINLFSKDQKRNAKSAITYWELINDLTYISSNVTGHGVKNQAKMQMLAGDLLSKTPDCSNIVTAPNFGK